MQKMWSLFVCEGGKNRTFLMQNGDFGRIGPRLDLPGKKIGGGPKAQGVSKSGEFNTLPAAKTFEFRESRVYELHGVSKQRPIN